jgi:hypothetical protein
MARPSWRLRHAAAVHLSGAKMAAATIQVVVVQASISTIDR